MQKVLLGVLNELLRHKGCLDNGVELYCDTTDHPYSIRPTTKTTKTTKKSLKKLFSTEMSEWGKIVGGMLMALAQKFHLPLALISP